MEACVGCVVDVVAEAPGASVDVDALGAGAGAGLGPKYLVQTNKNPNVRNIAKNNRLESLFMRPYSLSLKLPDHIHRNEMDGTWPILQWFENFLTKIPFSQKIQWHKMSKKDENDSEFPIMGTTISDIL